MTVGATHRRGLAAIALLGFCAILAQFFPSHSASRDDDDKMTLSDPIMEALAAATAVAPAGVRPAAAAPAVSLPPATVVRNVPVCTMGDLIDLRGSAYVRPADALARGLVAAAQLPPRSYPDAEGDRGGHGCVRGN